MILKKDSSEQKLRGAYYTPLPLAEMMVKLFESNASIKNVLEPSCGDGVFIDGLIKTGFINKLSSVTAIEIDTEEASRLKKRLRNKEMVTVLCKDFFEYYNQNIDKKFDLILGNPPYIRYQYLEENQREIMSSILTSHKMKSNKLINAWVGFLVACVHMLSDYGKIAFVIPAEILQVAYAEDLRLYLTNTLSQITLITFEKLVFPDIEQEVIVFIGEKGDQEKGIKIIELNDLDDLETLDLSANGFQKMQHVHEKWTKYFTSVSENEFIKNIKIDNRFHKLSDVALINVGITTGNNKYFSVTKDIVDNYKLHNVIRPLIGRSSHANSIYFSEEDWLKNVNKNKAAYLIDFPELPYEDYPKEHKKYIQIGESNKENIGYKCSIRDRWYRVPSIWIPDAFFLRRNNLYPKFVLNMCDAVSTDTMHRIKFNEGIEPERIILSYYNSISFAFTEICGRSYGGGVLEILPGEVGNVVLPKLDKIPMNIIKDTLKRIDTIIRNNDDVEQILDIVDNEILFNLLNIDKKMCETARGIWKKLQRRRLRRG